MASLDGLDDIRWAELTHAFGSADDVPRLLRMLTEDPASQEAAIDELSNTIWHQGTTYEATASAVPFLARVAVDEGAPRAELLYLLGCIADGRGYIYGSAEDPRSAEERARETAWVLAAREAVRRELPTLISAVRADMTRAVVAGFCRVAYAFPEETALLADVLNEAFEADDVTPLEQAGVAMALLRGGADIWWGQIVLLDVLVGALQRPSEQPEAEETAWPGRLWRRLKM